MNKYLLYMLFAVVAIILNLFTQAFLEYFLKTFFPNPSSILIFSFPVWFLLALGGGTLLGFFFKFIVDKYVIFKSITSLIDTSSELIKYFGFAIVTTGIFWGTEVLFLILFGEAYYLLGGLLGLGIGYSIKFLLDKKYVFIKITENHLSRGQI